MKTKKLSILIFQQDKIINHLPNIYFVLNDKNLFKWNGNVFKYS